MTDYQKYQLRWMIDHGFSLEDLVSGLEKLQYEDPEDSDRISTPISELFNEWIADVGFGSEIWACEAEWRECKARTKDEQSILNKAITTWGAGAQMIMVCEEMSELQKELCKNLRGSDNKMAIAEEIADVEIMLDQMKILFGIQRNVAVFRSQKIERLVGRLEVANNV